MCLITGIVLLFVVIKLVEESLEKPYPQGVRFDWDSYWKDVESGIDPMKQIKKQQKGGYWTTKPSTPKWYELPLDTIVDKDRYEHDRKTYGEIISEIRKNRGEYRVKKNLT